MSTTESDRTTGSVDRTAAVADDQIEALRQYAEAFVNAAAGGGDAEGAIEDLEAVENEALKKHPKFQQLLSSAQVSSAEKDRILQQVFEGRVEDVVLRFLRVLNRHGRLSLLSSLGSEARRVWDRRHHRIPVFIRTAVPLDPAQESSLRDRVARMISATPILHVSTDPSLIGGLVVQVGDQVCDASVRNRLEQLRHRLIEGKTHEIQSRRDQFSHSA
jgi:F-type H+-transporting ATPase subunit delta